MAPSHIVIGALSSVSVSGSNVETRTSKLIVLRKAHLYHHGRINRAETFGGDYFSPPVSVLVAARNGFRGRKLDYAGEQTQYYQISSIIGLLEKRFAWFLVDLLSKRV